MTDSTPHTYTSQEKTVTVIAHLSDPHLDGSPRRLRRLQATLECAAGLPELNAVVISGDLADHGAAGEYEQFFDTLPTSPPVLVIAGNHDLTAPLLDALGNHGFAVTLNSTLDIAGVRLIGLDSHIDHHDEGILGAAALDYARTQIADSDNPVILAMHHPPVPVGHHVMDRFGLENADDLAELIRSHDNIVGVFTGHVHSALATTYAGVPHLGAPGIVSTMRLGSKTDPVADLDAMPGLAVHNIDGTSISTVFHYLSPSAL
jgi:Icc protein